MQKIQGWSETGGTAIVIPGTQGSGAQRFQQSFRSATITVYLTGTSTLATIFADTARTAKANPFTASTTTGLWSFYVDGGRYDIKFSGGSILTPFTLSDFFIPFEFNVFQFGAKGDGTTDDTAAIQAAIDAAEAFGGGLVTFPAVDDADYYLITSTLTITSSGVVLLGEGARSTIAKLTAGDMLQIGDNVTQISDVVVDSLNFQGAADVVGWAINCRQAPNTLIKDCLVTCQSTGSGGINLSSCWDSRILSTTFGAIKGTGISINTSSNSCALKGNRIDGASTAAGIGILVSSTNIDIDGSNVIETIATCISVNAESCRIGAYFENYVRAIQVNSADAENLTVENAYFSGPAATAADAINLVVVNYFRIVNNRFAGTHTGGAPIVVGASAQNGEIGQNLYDDAAECILPSDLGLLNVNLWSERPYFSPRNLLANSFEVWPGGTTNSPPSIWNLSGGVAHTRESDAPIGRYSIECVGSGIGITTYPFPLISSTLNVSIRGRFAVFTIWAKSQSGTLASQLRLRIYDGVGTTDANRTLTTSWAQYTLVRKLDSAATVVQIIANCNNAGTIRISAAGFYIGSTVAVNGMETPQYSGMIANDQTDYAHTGTTNITVMKTETVLGTVMGTGGRIRVWATGTITGTAGQKDITIRLNGTGGTALATVTEAAGETGDWALDLEICCVSAASQRNWARTYQGSTLETQDYITSSVNTAANWTIDLCGDLGDAGDTITVKQFVIEAKNGI